LANIAAALEKIAGSNVAAVARGRISADASPPAGEFLLLPAGRDSIESEACFASTSDHLPTTDQRSPMHASRRTLMCLGPASFAAFDGTITLLGQRAEYWNGYAAVQEFNPLAYVLLQWHPAVFAIGIIIWIAFFTVMIHKLPIRYAPIVAFSIMLGHALGAATWLLQYRFGVLYVLLLFVVARALDTLIWERRRSAVVGSGVEMESTAIK